MYNIFDQKIHFYYTYYIPVNVTSKKLTITFEKRQKLRVLSLTIKDMSIIKSYWSYSLIMTSVHREIKNKK